MFRYFVRTSNFSVLTTLMVVLSSTAVLADPPDWLIKRVDLIKQRRAELVNPPSAELEKVTIIPGWNKFQASVLAELFINGKIDSIDGISADKAVPELEVHKGSKALFIVAKGAMKGRVDLGPSTYFDLNVTMVFDSNGNLVSREFVIPIGDYPGQFKVDEIKR